MVSSSFFLAQAALALLTALTAATPASALRVQKRATTCNGHPELCDLSYGNVTFVGAHDSYSVGTDNLATNQDYDVTQQLTDGVRLLQMQAHLLNNVIELCHTSCFLYDGGTLANYLSKVKTWMDANPNDVVTLLIVNSDTIPISSFDAVFQSAGLSTLSYVPPSSSQPVTAWPTLGSLIDGGTRLVTFLDSGADFSSVPYIIDEFSNVWETAFDVTDPTFDCNVNRTQGDPTTQMYLINHYLDEVVDVIATTIAPDKAALNVTNAVSGPGSLGAQAAECGTEYGRSPNFLLVDFYEYGGGSVFQVAAQLNGVTYAPTTPIATPIPDNSSGSSSTSDTTSQSNAAPSAHAPRNLWYVLITVLAGTALGAWTIL